ncbi:ATP-binding protein [Mucilaginibacter flavidus]|uniref:ATP-binding protein n=1 Tax=Mucilaginibacter flavidus TaxID=2949309 RepID=UPI0020922A30|nr:ATP-binding protein [Mucilaginibacter flavidus]MCO5949876.1 ATP-binding protein [Mucilaginibacter flavidus]
MKIIIKIISGIITLMACIINHGFGQDNPGIVHLGKLSAKGIMLDKGWRYTNGDNPDWANPGFDDTKWALVNPMQDIHQLPLLKPGVIGWFRLRFAFDSLEDKNLAAVMQISGASELYVDGRLIHRFGVISNDPEKIIAYDPIYKPLSFAISERATHVLAVRYVLQPGVRYTTMYETRNFAVQIQLLTVDGAIDQFQSGTGSMLFMHYFIMGACMILIILHFAFFLFYPTQKANLSFCIYALGFLLFNIVQHYFFSGSNLVASKFFLANFSMDLRLACNVFLLSALYNLLARQKDKAYWVLVILSIISVFLNTWPYNVGWKLGGALMEIFIGMGLTRIAYQATKVKIRGAWIILAGTICYFIFFSIFFTYALLPNSSFLIDLSITRIVFYILSFLSIPLAVSIFLGLDFAYTNRSLNEKLHEIEELSAKNILQEKEKQEILEAQNERLEIQVHERTNELSQSLIELRSTQSQLIQKEKLATLGELTAGIAHEIQNPLNFVNNFSEVSTELIDEMEQELEKGNANEAKVIAQDIKQNLEKINYHGKRADAIVKSMLLHSKTTSGTSELTNINQLVDEYLRLAYQGLRSKDNTFSVELVTDFDSNQPKINVIPQDIGRVLINLFNNAFYAVNQKHQMKLVNYKPEVRVSTYVERKKLVIQVKDNGMGIPDAIKEKIMQPFFTTKPTGQGTGLGLSLSYDIIVKGHGGELIVDSQEDEYTVFTIHLQI